MTYLGHVSKVKLNRDLFPFSNVIIIIVIIIFIIIIVIIIGPSSNVFSTRKRVCSVPLARRSGRNGAGLDEAEPCLVETVLAIVQA